MLQLLKLHPMTCANAKVLTDNSTLRSSFFSIMMLSKENADVLSTLKKCTAACFDLHDREKSSSTQNKTEIMLMHA